MTRRRQVGRFPAALSPDIICLFSNERGPWYETQEEVEAGLRWGRRKAALLRWVRRQMERRLTRREQRCVELYFFYGLSYRAAGRVTGTNASSVFRGVRRALRKLRHEAASGSAPGGKAARHRRRGDKVGWDSGKGGEPLIAGERSVAPLIPSCASSRARISQVDGF